VSLGALTATALVWSCAIASTVLWAARPSFTRSAGVASLVERALLIRPCAGDEPTLLRALLSISRAKRSFPLAVRIAVGSPVDGALPAAESASHRLHYEGLDARLVVTGALGPNRKVAQLAHVLDRDETSASVILVADSDVDLSDVALDELVRPLADPRVAAVWAMPVEIAPRTFADSASAAVLDGSLQSFAILGALDRGGMVGKLFAIRADALAQVGGFHALVTYLGEDMELARRLGAAGWRVQRAAVVAPSLAGGRSWGEATDRYARWIHVIRAQRPLLLVTYPAFLVATPLIVALSCIAALVDGAPALEAAVIAMGARVAAAGLARLRCRRPLRWLSIPIDVVLADALLLAAFLRALRSRSVTWRGTTLRHGDGRTFTESAPR
jgi:ceramide glucosyltransferase